ncbi:hypothetical protein Hdeb2414_s0126g00805241 [Helianthus debilis subsp. tardiflorus]
MRLVYLIFLEHRRQLELQWTDKNQVPKISDIVLHDFQVSDGNDDDIEARLHDFQAGNNDEFQDGNNDDVQNEDDGDAEYEYENDVKDNYADEHQHSNLLDLRVCIYVCFYRTILINTRIQSNSYKKHIIINTIRFGNDCRKIYILIICFNTIRYYASTPPHQLLELEIQVAE